LTGGGCWWQSFFIVCLFSLLCAKPHGAHFRGKRTTKVLACVFFYLCRTNSKVYLSHSDICPDVRCDVNNGRRHDRGVASDDIVAAKGEVGTSICDCDKQVAHLSGGRRVLRQHVREHSRRGDGRMSTRLSTDLYKILGLRTCMWPLRMSCMRGCCRLLLMQRIEDLINNKQQKAEDEKAR
jgi:hypothetical protein